MVPKESKMIAFLWYYKQCEDAVNRWLTCETIKKKTKKKKKLKTKYAI